MTSAALRCSDSNSCRSCFRAGPKTSNPLSERFEPLTECRPREFSEPPGKAGHDDRGAGQHEAADNHAARHSLLTVTDRKHCFNHRHATVTRGKTVSVNGSFRRRELPTTDTTGIFHRHRIHRSTCSDSSVMKEAFSLSNSQWRNESAPVRSTDRRHPFELNEKRRHAFRLLIVGSFRYQYESFARRDFSLLPNPLNSRTSGCHIFREGHR